MADMIMSLSAVASGQQMTATHAQAAALLMKKAMNQDEAVAAQMLEMLATAIPPTSGMDIKA